MKKYVLYVFLSIIFIAGLKSLDPRDLRAEAHRAIFEGDAPRAGIVEGDVFVREFDEETFSKTRRERVKRFVRKLAEHFKKNEFNKALGDFSHSKEFVDGELYPFVFDATTKETRGVCLAHGLMPYRVWENMYDVKDAFGTYIVRMIIKAAEKGDGWVTYQWRNTPKVSYVKMVKKNGRRVVVGSGFYPISKRDSLVNLVKSAVELFNANTAKGESPSESFSEFSYPLGRFILGDLYLFALDFDGNIVAQGERPGLIDQNALEYQDEKGKFVNKEIIKKLQDTSDETGIWVEYVSKRARKVAYAQEVVDKKGKHYFIACGYYPESDRKKVVELVKDGYTYMEKNGVSVSSRAFSDKNNLEFRYGDLWLFVCDYDGKCFAHGANPDLVGRNMINLKDDDEKYFIKNFIKKAKNGGGWVDMKDNNSYRFVYVEPIKVGVDRFLIASGLYPISKPEAMQLLVKGAAGYLRDNPKEVAFGEFSKRDGQFAKGDMRLFVFDMKGFCYVFGDNYRLVRKNMFAQKDEDGRPFVKLFINAVKEIDSGTVIYRENGRLKTAFVMKVQKGDDEFVIGSSFFAD